MAKEEKFYTVRASLKDLQTFRDDAAAFAVQFFDEKSGAAQGLQWIRNADAVQKFVRGIDAEALIEDGLNCDLTQTVFVRTGRGQVFSIELAQVREGERGYVVFTDGYVRTTPALATCLAEAYEIADYDSDRLMRYQRGPVASSDEEPPSTLPPTVLTGNETEIALYVYQDNPGADWNKRYAEAHAKSADTEAFEIDGLGSLETELQRLAKAGKVVKTLVLAAHGSAASFRIGKKDTPFNSPTRVGFNAGQTTPQAFGDAVKKHLVGGAQISLLTCKTALDSGTPETNGQIFIQQLADSSSASVGASDKNVTISGDQARTEGNWYTATPQGGIPKVTKAAPAGNIDP